MVSDMMAKAVRANRQAVVGHRIYVRGELSRTASSFLA